MNPDAMSPEDAAKEGSEEVRALVVQLFEVQKRLQEMTEGQVDAVGHPGGNFHLLQGAQEELCKSEARQRTDAATQSSILNALPAHIALVDRTGVIVSVNEAWRQFAGSSALVGSRVGENFLECCARVQGEGADQAHGAAAGLRAILDGTSKAFALDYRWYTPTEQRWYQLRVNPLERDGLRGAVVMHVEITQSKLAEEALRESEERFRGTFEQAVVGIAHVCPEGRFLRVNETGLASKVVRRHDDAQVREHAALLNVAHKAIHEEDLDGRITYWNQGAEETYGWSAAEALDRNSDELLRPDSAMTTRARAALLADGEWQGEAVKRTRAGREIVVEMGWTLVRDAQGRPKSLLAIDTDITARKRAEEELTRTRETIRIELEERVALRTQALRAAIYEAERANRAKSDFLSRMSHELRTPLHAILGFAQLLELDQHSVEDTDSVAQIVRAGNHLLRLINEVLDLARVESGKLTFTLEPVSVSAALEETFSLVRPQANAGGVRLEPFVGENGHDVFASAQHFKQILLNLLSNAVKYNRDGGTVSIASQALATCIRIEVADTGRGIAAENLQKLFLPFERLDVSDSNIEGAGLGLSLSKHLVEAMGGRIGVSSIHGVGSTFWLELPLVRGTTASSTARLDPDLPKVPERPRSTAPRTVLYIEDNLSNLRLVERILARRPEVKLISAMQGSIGLELARQHRPDLILLDLHLPDLQGDEILRRLRADPQTAKLPVVMISADATAAQIERLLTAGADDYLTKPIDMRKFLAVVDAVEPPAIAPPAA